MKVSCAILILATADASSIRGRRNTLQLVGYGGEPNRNRFPLGPCEGKVKNVCCGTSVCQNFVHAFDSTSLVTYCIFSTLPPIHSFIRSFVHAFIRSFIHEKSKGDCDNDDEVSQ